MEPVQPWSPCELDSCMEVPLDFLIERIVDVKWLLHELRECRAEATQIENCAHRLLNMQRIWTRRAEGRTIAEGILGTRSETAEEVALQQHKVAAGLRFTRLEVWLEIAIDEEEYLRKDDADGGYDYPFRHPEFVLDDETEEVVRFAEGDFPYQDVIAPCPPGDADLDQLYTYRRQLLDWRRNFKK
ncbi:MAG: hypothetical protein JST93_20720 [Acidobacteria bacterium]|nr:hypothetical protein [Acidobacteriota bacterium]